MTLDRTTRCPCLGGLTYGECCGRLHRGEAVAPTAVALMRSRFSAFAVGDADYLLATWDAATRPDAVDLDPAVRWLRLEVLSTSGGGPFDRSGTVEFAAHFRSESGRGIQRETSRFVRREGRWSYVDGVLG